MTRKYYNKLIRDRIPEIIKADNRIPSLSILDTPSFSKGSEGEVGRRSKRGARSRKKGRYNQ